MNTETSEYPTQHISYFEQTMAHGRTDALRFIFERYEKGPFIELRKFHDIVHTDRVIQRTGRILHTLQATDPHILSTRDIALGEFAAAFHDTVQEYEQKSEEKKGRFLQRRVRKSGTNEKQSADLALAYMHSVNMLHNGYVFSQSEIDIVSEAILSTIPLWDMTLETVVQPNLTPHVGLVAHALAFADINGGLMDPFAIYQNEFDMLLLEDNIDLAKMAAYPQALSSQDKTYFKERMIEWGEIQKKYIKGRQKAFFEKEILGIPKQKRKAIRQLFNRGDDTLRHLDRLVERRKQMSFDALLLDAGYPQPPHFYPHVA